MLGLSQGNAAPLLLGSAVGGGKAELMPQERRKAKLLTGILSWKEEGAHAVLFCAPQEPLNAAQEVFAFTKPDGAVWASFVLVRVLPFFPVESCLFTWFGEK